MRIYIFTLLVFVLTQPLFSQKWTQITENGYYPQGQVDFQPRVYAIFKISDAEIKAILWSAPHEKNVNVVNSSIALTIPTADGNMHTFSIVQYDMMEQGLADQFPDMRTFYGVDKNEPLTNIRIDYTPYGFRAVIVQHDRRTFIDYASRSDLNHRIVYYKKDYPKMFDWSCDFDQQDPFNEINRIKETKSGSRVGDCIFRTYRLANAATGEFSAFHGGTVALSQAAIVTIVNRVNQVYEADLAVRLVLVANNTNIVFTNAATDPYTNNNGVTMLGQNQTTCDNAALIGSANYDIGHVFSTGGGGVASLGVPCSSGSKARGVTGLSAPIGDPFAIDYVAHEMGHQFGGNHTFNNNSSGSCSGGNNNPSTSVEPGSGSTIMAYAGICSPVNIQNNSDAYFHAISLAEIFAEIATNTCDIESSFGNTKPIITALPDYTIPISTSFILDGIATDPEGDPLTYCWEQTDIATSTTAPTSTSTTQAQFRTILPTSNSRRYFPKISDIVNNTSTIWEVLPAVTRAMKFRFTVRDYHNIAGCTNEDNIIVNTNATAGPFVVNVLNSSPAPLLEGQTLTVLWSVANTNAAPVNAVNVDILLSYDGGYTYPVTLASGVPNDGSQDVTIPIGTSTTSRIMVKGSNNIFFDINNTNFTINSGIPTFTISLNPVSASVCNTESAIITVSSQSVNGYSTPINLSANSLPSGATAVFSPSSIIPGQSSTLLINNFGSNTGNFNINVFGSNADFTKNQVFALTLENVASTPALITPIDNAIDVSLTPTLNWSAGTNFEYEVSKDPAFVTIDANGFAAINSITLSSPLDPASNYYWRVRSSNSCGNSLWSPVRSFTTKICLTYLPTDLPLIMPVPVETATSTINIKDRGNINDIDVIDLNGAHTWIDDLIFTLSSPANTDLIIFNQPCNSQDNYDISFDDAAASSNYPCPPTDGLLYKPANPLSAFNAQSVKGNWKLKVDDVFPSEDGGQVNSWGIKVCMTDFCRLEVQNNDISGPGSLLSALECAISGDTISFASSVFNTQLDLSSQSLVINKNLTLLANPANNISIISQSTTAPTINITGAFNVNIIGLKIIGSQYFNAGIRNSGNLVLKNIEVKKNPLFSPTSLVSNVGGTISMENNCMIIE